jgi:prepilin-type N-terminal cleavage/methylation domain-containing protein
MYLADVIKRRSVMLRRCFRDVAGLSLVELMVAVAIIALVTAIAIPSFLAGKPLRELKADTLDVAGNLKFAKLSAVKNRVNTGLYFNNTGAAVNGVSPKGYCVYEDDGATQNQFDGTDTVIARKSNIRLRGHNQFSALTCTNNTVIFTSNGTATPSSGSITIENARTEKRRIVVNGFTGRIRIEII